MTGPRDTLPHVVILGGGFGGLYAARSLRNAPVRVTVVDRQNHHLFQPLLYQVATATLSPGEIASPIRGLLGRETTVLLAEVTGVDVAGKRVLLADGELSYDYLVIATGATHSYFGHDEWAKHSLGLKTIDDALEIRRRVLLAFERAERETDPVRRRELLTFVIIGAGPTGVEMAGALAEISRHSLARDFHNIDPSQARILLLEGLPRVLPVYPEHLSEKARRSLEKLGVEVRTDTRVTHIDETGVYIGEEHIRARSIIWAAGVAASPVARSLGVELDRAGRVKVAPELTLPGRRDVFVIGDLAHFVQDGDPIPGVAPAAMQQGKQAARNILRQLRGQPMEAFRYWDRGTYAVIGRGKAVGVAFRRFESSGFSAWLAWLGIHVLFLIGFRSKLAVLINWAYSFIAFKRSARLITGPLPELVRPERAGEGPLTSRPGAGSPAGDAAVG
ncbi:NADH dehydrogenase FAD-containing subunit [Archangium gephyra]|uniref:NADH:ubiquinone reductase (non-electrogenic) n=1 Tax=Archangium gephyra TaxID=48 RepID=A0AAC8Q6G3_9BACT|nr:NAD(P)/FAD-dependent oxidoreductase [Archangium gephyra]AKJ01268.1 NADH dehydrogenase [Archangium gephyra]REG24421.1 NADH dehydrogenase FAD-containing subunit [Archangium gephyra]